MLIIINNFWHSAEPETFKGTLEALGKRDWTLLRSLSSPPQPPPNLPVLPKQAVPLVVGYWALNISLTIAWAKWSIFRQLSQKFSDRSILSSLFNCEARGNCLVCLPCCNGPELNSSSLLFRVGSEVRLWQSWVAAQSPQDEARLQVWIEIDKKRHGEQTFNKTGRTHVWKKMPIVCKSE